MPIQYTHPHVHSEIVDEDVVFLTSVGLTNLFACFGAERGPEELRYVTTPDEFVHVYGEPDFDTYGQQPLQVVNWVGEQGGAWCLRVANSDATVAGVALMFGKTTTHSTDGFRTSTQTDTSQTDYRGLKAVYYPMWWESLQTSTTTGLTEVDNVEAAVKNPRAVPHVDGAVNIFIKTKPNTGETLDSRPPTTDITDPTILVVIHATGRGKWYDNLKVRLVYQDQFEDTYDFAVYRLDVLEEKDGTDVELEQYYVSFKKGAQSRERESMYITDVLARNSEWVRAVVNEAAFNGTGTSLKSVYGDSEGVFDPYDVDIFDQGALWAALVRKYDSDADSDVIGSDGVAPTSTDSNENGKIILADSTSTSMLFNQRFVVTTESTSSAKVGEMTADLSRVGASTATGVIDLARNNVLTDLEGGNEGSDTTDGLGVAQARLVDRYEGGGDAKRIKDRDDLEVDVLLDANYEKPVKDAMVSLARNRGDCIVMRDLGTPRDAGSTGSTMGDPSAIGTRKAANDNTVHVAYWSQDFRVYDRYSGKNVRVTAPYVLSRKIPQNDRENGFYKNFVGPRRGTVTGVVPGSWSWFPSAIEREALYKNQINYVQKDPRQVYLGSQSTSQRRLTPMSDISIARTAWRMVRRSRRISDLYRFEWFNPATFSGLQNNLQEALNEFVFNGSVESVSVLVSATGYERAQKLARVQIRTKFTDIIERVAIGFVVTRTG